MASNSIGAANVSKRDLSCEIIRVECMDTYAPNVSIVIFDKEEYEKILAKEKSFQAIQNQNNLINSGLLSSVIGMPQQVCHISTYKKCLYLVTNHKGKELSIKTSRIENACSTPEHKIFNYIYPNFEAPTVKETEKKDIPESKIKVCYYDLNFDKILPNPKDVIKFFSLSKIDSGDKYYCEYTLKYNSCKHNLPDPLVYLIAYPDIKFKIELTLPTVTLYNTDKNSILGTSTKANSEESKKYNAHTNRAITHLKDGSVSSHDDAQLMKIQSIEFSIVASVSYADRSYQFDFGYVSDTFKRIVGCIHGVKDFSEKISLTKLTELPDYKKKIRTQIAQGFEISFTDCFSSSMKIQFLPKIVDTRSYQGAKKMDNVYRRDQLSIGLPNLISGKWTLHVVKLVQYIMQNSIVKDMFFAACPPWGSVVYYILRGVLALINRTECIYFNISLSAGFGFNIGLTIDKPLYGTDPKCQVSGNGKVQAKFALIPEAGINIAGYSLIATINVYYQISLEVSGLDDAGGYHEVGGDIKIVFKFPGLFQRKYDNEIYVDEVTTDKAKGSYSWTKKFDTIRKKIGE